MAKQKKADEIPTAEEAAKEIAALKAEEDQQIQATKEKAKTREVQKAQEPKVSMDPVAQTLQRVELDSVSLHGAPSMTFCGKSIDKTINRQKHGFANIRMHLTPLGVVLTLGKNQAVIPSAAVALVNLKQPLFDLEEEK